MCLELFSGVFDGPESTAVVGFPWFLVSLAPWLVRLPYAWLLFVTLAGSYGAFFYPF